MCVHTESENYLKHVRPNNNNVSDKSTCLFKLQRGLNALFFFFTNFLIVGYRVETGKLINKAQKVMQPLVLKD